MTTSSPDGVTINFLDSDPAHLRVRGVFDVDVAGVQVDRADRLPHDLEVRQQLEGDLRKAITGVLMSFLRRPAGAPFTGHQTRLEQACICTHGWICEAHPTAGWPHAGCESEGIPCPRCNPRAADLVYPD